MLGPGPRPPCCLHQRRCSRRPLRDREKFPALARRSGWPPPRVLRFPLPLRFLVELPQQVIHHRQGAGMLWIISVFERSSARMSPRSYRNFLSVFAIVVAFGVVMRGRYDVRRLRLRRLQVAAFFRLLADGFLPGGDAQHVTVELLLKIIAGEQMIQRLDRTSSRTMVRLPFTLGSTTTFNPLISWISRKKSRRSRSGLPKSARRSIGHLTRSQAVSVRLVWLRAAPARVSIPAARQGSLAR